MLAANPSAHHPGRSTTSEARLLLEGARPTEWEAEDLLRLIQGLSTLSSSLLLVLDADLNVLMANDRTLDAAGVGGPNLAGRNLADVLPDSLPAKAAILQRLRGAVPSGDLEEWREALPPAPDRGPAEVPDRYLDLRLYGLPPDRASTRSAPRAVLALDETTEPTLSDEQLQEAAKWAPIGKLAAGAVHDLNNLLTGIIGYAEILLEGDASGAQASQDLEGMRDLAKRAAALTRQLLSLGRGQLPEPVVLDLNALVPELLDPLRRLVGTGIDLEFLPGLQLGKVAADPTQVEQVLTNLALNARDAMAEGGEIVIEAENADLDLDYAQAHTGVKPGRYVMLAVSDTGCGMDEATRQRVFEPFFTTKPPTRGSGLGLATVYAMVKQCGGNVWVYSEPGRGTTIKVYLPRLDGASEEATPAGLGGAGASRSGGILVVEEDAVVRRVIRQVLEAEGHVVLTAGGPEEASRIFNWQSDDVALLVTDLVMFGVSGRELYEQLAAVGHSLKVLYTSGYPAGAVFRGGLLPEGSPLLSKPFTRTALASKVRELLASRD